MNWNIIQEEIDKNLVELREGDYDPYTFVHDMMNNHIAEDFPEALTLGDHNPFADLVFALLEINYIELY